MMKRRLMVAVVAMAAVTVAVGAQERPDTLAVPRFKLDVPTLQPLQPVVTFTAPNVVTPPTFNYRPLEMPKVSNNLRGLSDEVTMLPVFHGPASQPLRVEPRYNFDRNPYSRDWSASGVIARYDNAYLGASGGYTTLPALGTVGSASLSFTGVYDDDRLTLTAGMSGMKYHMGRDAWNDYGFFGRASYRLSDGLSLNLFGQYYLDQRFHSVAAMGYMQDASYGGTLGIKLGDNVGLNLGAQRYYDTYSHRWRTLPVVAPVVNVFGQPMSFDVGGLIYEFVDALIHNNKKYDVMQGRAPRGGGPVPVTPVDVNRRALGGSRR